MKHVQVREYLRGLIGADLNVGDAIPSERLLCERFAISRMTVRQAVDALVVEGILERKQGKGTFVASAKVDLQLRLTSFGEEMRARGMMPGTRLLAATEVAASAESAAGLGLEEGAPVYRIDRVRLADGTPMSVDYSYASVAMVPGFITPCPPESLYGSLRERGFGPNWGEDIIEGVLLTGEVAELLHVRSGSAGLHMVRRTFCDNQAVLYSRCYYRADRYALWVPVAAPGRRLYPPGGTPESRKR